MRKTLLMATVASVFALNATALELNPYVSLKYLRADFDNQFTTKDEDGNLQVDAQDTTNGLSFAIGNNFATKYGKMRAEFEYKNYADAKNKNNDMSMAIEGTIKNSLEVQAYMFNIYYDFETNTKFSPYIGGGIGWADVKAETKLDGEKYFSKQADNLAWQVGAGIAYNVNENFILDAGYRHVDYGMVDKNYYYDGYGYRGELSSEADELYFGLRYNF